MKRIGLVSIPHTNFGISDDWRHELLSAQGVPFNPKHFLSALLDAPSHPGSVMSKPEASLRIQQNNPAVPADAISEVIHRFRRDPLRQIA